MKRESILIAVVALLVGLLGGYLVFSLSSDRGGRQAAPSAGADAASAVDQARRIAELEQVVAREPANLNAWITLGNDYFDSRQPQKAIQAYGRALELKPDNPDVLTDQGIMYRALGWYDRALANFEKAQKLDPKHLQSLFNLGLVHAVDLKQPAKAAQFWTRYLTLDATSPTAQRVREALEEMGRTAPKPAPH